MLDFKDVCGKFKINLSQMVSKFAQIHFLEEQQEMREQYLQ